MSDSKKDEIEPSENPKISKKDGAEFYEMYSKYNDILRTWFVAFGLGGLYLLLTNKELITYLKLHKVNGTVEICFLIGVASQIIIALINKFFNWIIYFSTISKNFHKRRIYRIADRVSEFIWIDFIFDLVTVVTFIIVIGIMMANFG